MTRTVFALQEFLKVCGEIVTVAILLQCLFQLVTINGVALVFVEIAEYALPALRPHCKNTYVTGRRQTPHTPRYTSIGHKTEE
jgi:hypothetical protein